MRNDIFRHSKNYVSLSEENEKREIWKEEMEMVDRHNKEAEVVMIVMIMVIMLMISMMMMMMMMMILWQK